MAKQRANAAQLAELNKWYTEEDHREKEKIKAVQKIFRELEIDRLTREEVIKFSHKALETLERIETNTERKEELRNFTNKLIYRVS